MTHSASRVAQGTPLTLVLHGLRAAAGHVPSLRAERLPALGKALARGTMGRVEGGGGGRAAYRAAVLQAAGTAVPQAGDAALEWLGYGGALLPGDWWRADLVHVEMGARSAFLRRIAPVGPDEYGALVDSLATGLAAPGLDVHPVPGGRATSHLYLRFDAPTRVAGRPLPVDVDVEVDLGELLPQGAGGAVLRRLVTEAQMVLHEHPVNAGRERARQRSVNAVWLSGGGGLAAPAPGPLPPAWTDDAWLSGLYRWHGLAVQSLAAPVEQVLAAAGPALVCTGLPDDALQGLRQFDAHWVEPALAAVSAGQIASCRVCIDDVCVTVDRSALRRFWRRGADLSRVCA